MIARSELYGSTDALPTLYVLAKLYVHCSKLLNKTLQDLPLSADDLETLYFYTNIMLERANVSLDEVDKIKEEREAQYNAIYSCKEHLNEADLLSFLVVKALRMKNIFAKTHEVHKDSAIDFLLYLRMYQTLLVSELTLPL